MQKRVQFEAVLEAGIEFGAKEVTNGVDAAVVREEDSVGGAGIGGETWVFKHPSMENELEHQRIGAVPTERIIMGLLAETMVGQVRAEVIKNGVFRAVGEQIKIESSWKTSDVDPPVGTLRSIKVNNRFTIYNLK